MVNRLDLEIVNKLLDLSICCNCLLLFSNGNSNLNKIIHNDKENNELYINNELKSINKIYNNINICQCCYNCLSHDKIKLLCSDLVNDLIQHNNINDKNKQINIKIKIELAPIINIFRNIFKSITTNNKYKSNSFNSFEDIVKSILSNYISLHCKEKLLDIQLVNDINEADYTVNIIGNIENQALLCQQLLNDNFTIKKKKRPRSFVDSQKTVFEISDHDTDVILSMLKDYNTHDYELLKENLITISNNINNKHEVIFESTITRSTIYLLGRYNKYSRDIPQSPWIIDDERKGRYSVEEIINDAIHNIIQSKICRLHGCGREDIDVRCLGNGRPFVLELLDCVHEASPENLLKITKYIKDKQGLNIYGDIDISNLIKVNKTTWENMQNVAEEKKKAYSCIVWSDGIITLDKLKQLELMSSSLTGISLDEEGRRCLEIIQKTPLRVLHRRSLISRKRYIYDINTILINPHFFIMKLITSAGAYVKEFVHGDVGRTEPSISSILDSQADILQLDVIGLFDQFEGGYNHDDFINNYPDNTTNDSNILSWHDLKTLKLIPFKNE